MTNNACTCAKRCDVVGFPAAVPCGEALVDDEMGPCKVCGLSRDADVHNASLGKYVPGGVPHAYAPSAQQCPVHGAAT